MMKSVLTVSDVIATAGRFVAGLTATVTLTVDGVAGCGGRTVVAAGNDTAHAPVTIRTLCSASKKHFNTGFSDV